MTDQDFPNTVGEVAQVWAARPKDEGPFWQRQREQMAGRIEDPAVTRKPFPWKRVGWGLVGVIVGGMWWLA